MACGWGTMPATSRIVRGLTHKNAKAMQISMLNRKPLLLASLLLWLTGCVSTPEAPPEANAGRYSMDQDRAPSEPLDPSRIREVVPEVETRTLAGNRSPYSVNGQRYTVMSSEAGYEATGRASWYGEKFHGHRTSNGEVFDMYQLSAAHRSLPIPSYLRVTNLDNQRSILVRVNDRGPFHSERIIDLSYAAAWKLGFSDQGTARVHLEAIVPGGGPAENGTRQADAEEGPYLQVGAFADRGSAERLRDRVQRMTGEAVFIRSVRGQGSARTLHRVRVGPLSDAGQAARITDMMEAADLGRPYVINE